MEHGIIIFHPLYFIPKNGLDALFILPTLQNLFETESLFESEWTQWPRERGCRGCNCTPRFQKLSHKNAIKPKNSCFWGVLHPQKWVCTPRFLQLARPLVNYHLRNIS